jgi:hypothetical protein
MDNQIKPVILKLRSQARELWPENPPTDFAIVRRFLRPYSQVYRIQLLSNPAHANAAPPRFIYAKIMTPGEKFQADPEKYTNRLATEFLAARRLSEALSKTNEYTVVKPVAYYPELLTMVTVEAPGESLSGLIQREGKLTPAIDKMEQLAKHCRRAGLALAAIQKVTMNETRFDPASLAEYIDVRLHRLMESDSVPFTAADRQQILRFLAEAIPAIPAAQLVQCGCHSDYAPFNVLAAPEKITVVDFTMFKVGSVYNDLTYFYHRLEGYLHKPIYRPATIRRMQEAFLQGYVEANGRPTWRAESDLLFKVFWIRHVVNNYSAIMRQRVVITGRHLSLPARLFNRYVFHRYTRWLNDACRYETEEAYDHVRG